MEFITAEALQEKMENSESFTLLDVREPFEANISNFKQDSLSIPFQQLSNEISNLEKNKEYIVYCRSGATSKDACRLLKKAGFERVISLKGGINEWAKKMDPSLPQY